MSLREIIRDRLDQARTFRDLERGERRAPGRDPSRDEFYRRLRARLLTEAREASLALAQAWS